MTKKRTKYRKRAQLWIFTPQFSKFRVFRTLHPSKRQVFFIIIIIIIFSRENSFHFSKRALRAGTARNKWLKKP